MTSTRGAGFRYQGANLKGVVPLLVDERRLAAGLDSALTALAAQAPRDLLTPASLLERLTGHHVFSDRERRALVRRIALTRDGLDLPHHVRMAPSFAARVVAAIDTGHEGTPLDPLIEQYTTLLAFSDMLDVQTALKRALAGERRALDIALLAVDAVLVADDDGAFAWRRLCAAAGIPLEIVDLGPIEPLAIDRIALRGITAMLAFAASGSDGDARRAILSRIAGIGLDDARAMLTAAGERSTLLETIDATKVLLGPRARRDAGAFARGLRAIARAYAAPDAGAATVLGALGAAFTIADAPTAVALASVAQAFDRARSIGPQWTATELIAEIDAEFADARLPVQPAPMVEPLTVVAPLAATPVPQRQRHFSASSLNAYAECARKWYFRYVCAAVEDRGSSASFYGTAFHAALEDFHLRYPRVQETPQSDLATALDAMVIGAFDRYRGRFDAPVEFELQRRRARRTAKRYLHWLIERAQRAPFTVIGCETATDLDLDGHAFVGYIDRLDRDDRTGDVTVIDYKTGTIAMSAEEYRRDVAAFREFQLPFYYWAREAAGDRVTRLALIPLKDALLDVVPIELEIIAVERPMSGRASGPVGTISRAELERARAKMIAYAALLSSATIEHFPATDDPDACRYCAYADACRERPLVREERFGR